MSPFRRVLSVGVLALGAAVPASVAAEVPPSVSAELRCANSAKLIICVVPLRATGRGAVSWADGTIESAPAFTKPAWSYASYHKDGVSEPLLKFGLIPTGHGKGTLSVRVRARVCPVVGPLCPSLNRVYQAPIVVP
jgi:hypothetical protein